MNRFVTWAICVFAFLLLLMSPIVRAEDDSHDAELTKKIDKIIREVEKLKVGMSRADLLKVFATEGGLSNRKRRRFVHRSCPYIKVDVEFEAVGDEKDLLRENIADKIAKISQPFLEFSIGD